MKICVIGNSHVAVVKVAYDQMRAKGDTPDMKFFADSGPGIERLVLHEGGLWPEKNDTQLLTSITTTSGGLTHIDPAKYDIFLVIGLARSIENVVELVKRPISESARNRALQDYWDARAAVRMLEKLMWITDKPLYLGLTPLMAAEKLNDDGPDDYEKMVALSKELYLDDMNVTLISQPSATIVNGQNTKLEYSRGSLRLGNGKRKAPGVHLHPDGEYRHMNAAYGALWLEHCLSRLNTTA